MCAPSLVKLLDVTGAYPHVHAEGTRVFWPSALGLCGFMVLLEDHHLFSQSTAFFFPPLFSG